MEKTVSATEVVRDFSTILNKVKFAGDKYIIQRSGKPVARILPVEKRKPSHSLKDLKMILNQLPRLGEDLDTFSDELKSIINEQPEISDSLRWA